jgi:hypothetical protein
MCDILGGKMKQVTKEYICNVCSKACEPLEAIKVIIGGAVIDMELEPRDKDNKPECDWHVCQDCFRKALYDTGIAEYVLMKPDDFQKRIKDMFGEQKDPGTWVHIPSPFDEQPKFRGWGEGQQCLHEGCPDCHGTGRKADGTMCIHSLSCPCPKCSPRC